MLACALAVAIASAAARTEAVPRDAILYSIGISTDPHGTSRPRGFGVVTGIASGGLARTEVRTPEYRGFPGVDWFDRGRIIVARRGRPSRRSAIFSYSPSGLVRDGFAPFPGGSEYKWSPDRRWIAFAPPAPPLSCAPERSIRCYQSGVRISVTRADGSGRHRVATGVLGGWTRQGRLAFYRTGQAWTRGDATLLDIRTGKRTLRRHFWTDQQPIQSADGRYFASLRGIKNRTRISILRSDGHVVQTMTTHYNVSMLAWSTRGHLLAYTTSGFPSPHQLFVVDPGRDRRKILATGAAHFDWITWSPDGRWILLDGAEYGGWRLFSARTGRQVRLLPRLGGRPLWCCPVNEYRLNA